MDYSDTTFQEPYAIIDQMKHLVIHVVFFYLFNYLFIHYPKKLADALKLTARLQVNGW